MVVLLFALLHLFHSCVHMCVFGMVVLTVITAFLPPPPSSFFRFRFEHVRWNRAPRVEADYQ
jgi:hypothetical protein